MQNTKLTSAQWVSRVEGHCRNTSVQGFMQCEVLEQIPLTLACRFDNKDNAHRFCNCAEIQGGFGCRSVDDNNPCIVKIRPEQTEIENVKVGKPVEAPPISSKTGMVNPATGTFNFWPAFLLCLLLGVFGAHRFYAKRFKSGLIQLVTCGGFGVWTLIDLVMILLGKFADVNGRTVPNPNPKTSWGIAVVFLIVGLASQSGNPETRNGNSGSTQSSSISESDVTGRWVGYYNGLVGADITLYSDGTGTYSSDYGSGEKSLCSWRLSGRNIIIDMRDGGSSLSFYYKDNNTLVGGDHVLYRK
jgi:hypothetical protein